MVFTYLIACSKPAGHREVVQGSVLCTPRWKLEREAEVKRRRGEEDRVV